ncbi:MAG: polyhydroxyalkanoate synthesis repressor PhaR [Colwellia sp. Phe_37]|jgi:polyhydroxyalkanoate synthesis repressor PhaR|nr:MAG: polyhydroxyalkanoate synthesis repressor PhaR [Cycloclasticus sp. Phe_18]KXJ51243.1 MAG: polyhydroxyalkanoate synthesis repressor PhaR [Colwellia sp. Phe_37]
MVNSRIIKKYPNRRLYDTEISKYVTLNDVRQLIIDREPVKVVDAKSKEDLTRSVLLQIILEQEEDGEPIMSAQMLEQLIRFYGDPFQHNFANYLENSVKLIAEQRAKVRSQLQQAADPFALMTSLANRNMEVFKEMQEGLFKKVMPGPSRKKDK